MGVIHIWLAWVRSADLRLPALGFTPSVASGVGHCAAVVARFIPCWPAACDGVGFVCRFSLALARGVGQRRKNSVRFPPLERVPEQARGVGQFVPFPDGKDEQAFATVGRADFRRRKQSCRKTVAHADQSAGDFGEAEAEMMGDIFEKDEGRLNLADDPGDMRPEVAWILRAPTLARDGERLARIARSDDVHRAAPRAAVECGNVVPDNRLIQGRVRHPRHESGRSICFPLDMAHSSISGQGEGEAEIDPARAGAEGKPEEAGVIVPVNASGGR